MLYSWILGYTDVIMAAIAITIVTYLWLIRSIAKIGVFRTFEYKDLTLAIAVYSFISFYIAGMALFLSGKPVDFIHALLMVTPITVWTFIWTDFYLQKLKGEPKDKPPDREK